SQATARRGRANFAMLARPCSLDEGHSHGDPGSPRNPTGSQSASRIKAQVKFVRNGGGVGDLETGAANAQINHHAVVCFRAAKEDFGRLEDLGALESSSLHHRAFALTRQTLGHSDWHFL